MVHSVEKLLIREYQELDRSAMIKILFEFQNYLVEIDTKKNCQPFHSNEEAEKYLNQSIDDATTREGKFFVAEVDDSIAGFAQILIDRHEKDILYNTTHSSGAHGWIGELYTKPEFRGQGIGKKLIEKAEKHFKSNGCVSSRLVVMADNELARSVYDKLGYSDRDVELSKDL